jgi:hypothetical protein
MDYLLDMQSDRYRQPSTTEALLAKLLELPIPRRQIDVYGSRIVVTCRGESSARKWATVLARFAKVEAVALRSLDLAKKNKNTVITPSRVRVYRTYAVIGR